MTYFDSLQFVYRLVFERFDLIVWGWATVAFVLSLVGIHWLWGRAWNAQWGLLSRPGTALASLVLALLVGGAVLTWLAAERSGQWLELQRAELTRQVADSGSRNRRILVDARGGIGHGPDENTLTLRSNQDLMVLAQTAAADVRCPLTPSGPLGPGAPCRVRDPRAVAQDVVRTVAGADFPLDVSPDNPWIRAAVTARVEEALSFATPRLRAGMDELRTLVAVVLCLALGIQALMVPLAAVGDIRVNPSV